MQNRPEGKQGELAASLAMKARDSRPGRMRRKLNLLPYGLVAPCILLLAGFLLYPIIDELYLSLTRWSLLYERNPIFVGLSAYHELLSDNVFWASLWRSCIWTAGTIVFQFVVGFPLALALRHRTRLTGLATGLMLLPFVTPTVVAAYGWAWALDSQFGFIYALLHWLHLVGSVSPLADYGMAMPTVTIVSGWKGTPFVTVALLAAMKNIPSELYEAAKIDGAGFLQQHRHITLAGVRTTALVIGMLSAIGAFYSFDLAWLITNGGPGDATQLVGIYLFKTFQYNLDYAYAAQIAVGMFVTLGVAVFLYLKVAQPNRE